MCVSPQVTILVESPLQRFLSVIASVFSTQASMGVDFYLKRLVLGNERNVNVQVWDVAGSALSGKMTDKVRL